MSFPDVAEAFWGLTDAIQFIVVTRQYADFESGEVVGDQSGFGQGGFGLGGFGGDDSADLTGVFDGSLEPIAPFRLMIKPEGQRSWRWWILWTERLLSLGDKVLDTDGKRYKVMSISNWSGGGYYEYELREGFDEP